MFLKVFFEISAIKVPQVSDTCKTILSVIHQAVMCHKQPRILLK